MKQLPPGRWLGPRARVTQRLMVPGDHKDDAHCLGGKAGSQDNTIPIVGRTCPIAS